jgi:hypothetical protein
MSCRENGIVASATDRIVSKYLRTLQADLSGLPAALRKDVLRDTQLRIADGRAKLSGGGNESEVRALLHRIGDPAEGAATAWQPYGFERPKARRREVTALVLLLVGGCAFFLGWIAGVFLLWSSSVWTLSDKLLGTLLIPGGLGVPLVLLLIDGRSGGSQSEFCDSTGLHCNQLGPASNTHGPFPAGLLIALVAVQVLVVAYLSLRLRARPAPEPAVL